MPPLPGAFRVALFALAALIAFAANSLLCRTALGAHAIDAASFTGIRLVSGAFTLAILARLTGTRPATRSGSWASALALFTYAAAFSFAYVRMGAGVGALILFSAVQMTMFAAALRSGERPRAVEWIGWLLALGGLFILVAPFSIAGLAGLDRLASLNSPAVNNASAPAPIAALSMMAAGAAWAFYTLRGRRSSNPLLATADNFARSVVPCAALSLITLSEAHLTTRGVLLACASGALASGLGYSLWYSVLPSLSATRAAIIQLAVPVLAATAAVALLDEPPTPRLVLSAATILTGIALSLSVRVSPRR